MSFCIYCGTRIPEDGRFCPECGRESAYSVKNKKAEDIKPVPTPKPTIETKPVEIPVKPRVVVVPAPQPAPEPIAPVKPKEEPFKKVSIALDDYVRSSRFIIHNVIINKIMIFRPLWCRNTNWYLKKSEDWKVVIINDTF